MALACTMPGEEACPSACHCVESTKCTYWSAVCPWQDVCRIIVACVVQMHTVSMSVCVCVLVRQMTISLWMAHKLHCLDLSPKKADSPTEH